MLAIFFDIDGTLLDTGGAGGAAMREAFAQQFGVPEPARVPYSGCTDRGIGAAMFNAHGMEDSDENWHRLRDSYLSELDRQLPRHDGRVLPGVTELLTALRELSSTRLGLLTGNVRTAARLKLVHYGLDGAFEFGGFGDHLHDRDQVAAMAMDEAQGCLQSSIERAVVIGDTPLDVRCARAIGADVIAVATGIHHADELASASPDLLLDDLSQTRRIEQFLGL